MQNMIGDSNETNL